MMGVEEGRFIVSFSFSLIFNIQSARKTLPPSIPPFLFSTFEATLEHYFATATASFLFSNEYVRMRAYFHGTVLYINASISALMQALIPTSPQLLIARRT